MNIEQEHIHTLAESIQQSKKYRTLCYETIVDVILQESVSAKTMKQLKQNARKKLHQIAALYLGDPDYQVGLEKIHALPKPVDTDQLKRVCQSLLSHHASTQERLAIIDSFYEAIFSITGYPKTIMDLASGLNPLFLPWFPAPPAAIGSSSIEYTAYEINANRTHFLNAFFAYLKNSSRMPILGKAEFIDIVANPPTHPCDVAFLLKMVHCLERRKKNLSLTLLEKLQATWIVVSFPIHNLHKTRDLKTIYSGMFEKLMGSKSWEIHTMDFENEWVAFIKK